jgi:hypothetical protein
VAAIGSPDRAGDPARPSFDRPSNGHAAPIVAPPTRLVGLRPRPVIPRPGRRRVRPRPVAVIGVALFVVAIALAGAIWARAGGRSAHAVDAAANRGAQVETKSATATTLTTSATSTRRTVPAAPARSAVPDAAADPARSAVPAPHAKPDWSAALSGLDAVRARAFATRDAGLLRRVYVPGPLLAADTALLARIVPAGCTLAGARTRYTGLRAAAHGDRVDVTVTATLPPSRLMCAGHLRATAPGAGPAALQLTLAQTPAGLRIAAQRMA